MPIKPYEDYFKQDYHREQPFYERDKRIVNSLSCWHEADPTPHGWEKHTVCKKCGADFIYRNPNLSTPNGYFWLLDVITESKHGSEFMRMFPSTFPSPDIFADVVDAYLTLVCDASYRENI